MENPVNASEFEREAGAAGADARDILISRVIDAEGDERAWEEFSRRAGGEPGAWAELAAAQRQHAALVREVGRATAGAAGVELPTHDAAGVSHGVRLAGRISRWGGWAVAAGVTAAWVGGLPGRGAEVVDEEGPGTVTAGWTINSPRDALSAYFEVGRESGEVIGQVPGLILLESAPAAGGGGYEVLYVRQLMERAVVPDFYRFAADEGGNRVLMRVSQPVMLMGAEESL